jgi:hypothetical protein
MTTSGINQTATTMIIQLGCRIRVEGSTLCTSGKETTCRQQPLKNQLRDDHFGNDADCHNWDHSTPLLKQSRKKYIVHLSDIASWQAPALKQSVRRWPLWKENQTATTSIIQLGCRIREGRSTLCTSLTLLHGRWRHVENQLGDDHFGNDADCHN